MKLHKVLTDIVAKKRYDLAASKQQESLAALRRRALATAYTSRFASEIEGAEALAVIAEIKLASPTNPGLGQNADILDLAATYQAGGATAISFITEPHYFQGTLSDLARLKKHTTLPVLQKDFVVDPYQIYEARAASADALLLIARLVDTATLRRFVELAQEIGVEPVVEINNAADLKKTLTTSARVVAVNARDLETFTIDLSAACRLLQSLPASYIRLGFSGIRSRAEAAQYQEAGAHGVLVGTSLMQAADPGRFLYDLRA